MRRLLCPLIASALCLLASNARAADLILYTSIDEPYVRPIVRDFEKQTGLSVQLVTDTEATKTAGLVEKLAAEAAHPRADVYWGNEIFHTLQLTKQGLFQPYASPAGADISPRWRDAGDLWHAVGLRARVIAISTRPEAKDAVAPIRTLEDLTNPALKGHIALCHPAFGTASGHIAALYLLWGPEKFDTVMRGLRANDVKLLGGNSAVADQIASGALWAGPTDNDDVTNGKSNGDKIEQIIPNQSDIGTLMMPTTLALVAGAPHPDAGKKLIDFLLDPAIEKRLIDAGYIGYSVRGTHATVKAMDLDYPKAAAVMRTAVERALTLLQNREP